MRSGVIPTPAPLQNMWPTLSRPLPDAVLRAISFGAGVQSTTLYVLAAEGSITPRPDVAIFADTGDEPAEVYDHLEHIRSLGLGIPIEVVSAGSIRDQLLGWAAGTHQHANGRPPLFVKKEHGAPGRTRRQCTQDWKIVPIERRVRELAGVKPRSPGPKAPIVEQWIGISTDEAFRLKPARRRWIHNRHPLIEADMDRRACIAELNRRGIRAPKSACRICTFHDDAAWQRLKLRAPADFEAACEVDDALRRRSLMLRGQPYLHRSCKPLREIDFTGALPDPIAWLGECEGMCGV